MRLLSLLCVPILLNACGPRPPATFSYPVMMSPTAEGNEAQPTPSPVIEEEDDDETANPQPTVGCKCKCKKERRHDKR